MSLPILDPRHASSPADLLRLFYRTEVRWLEHLAAPVALDIGTAFTNSDLPLVHDANHILDVALPSGIMPQEAMQLVDDHFAPQRTRCHHWMMTPNAPDDQTRPMIDHLLSLGYQSESLDVLYLRQLAPAPEAPALTIIPARAAYRYIDQPSHEHTLQYGPQVAQQLAQARLLHLDDPHYDALLALKDAEYAGYVGVLSVGEIGRIEPLHVAQALRRQGIARTLMSRALEICARSLFKHIFLSVSPTNTPAQSLYRSLGFAPIGQITLYRMPSAS